MSYAVAYLIGIVLIVCTRHAGALEEHDSALGALQRLDYQGAAEILRYLADNGDPSAQAALAVLIESGEVELDYPLPPRSLIRAAAEQGLPQAALELGNRNYLGKDQVRNFEQAINWWRIAAENGSPAAAFNLGLAYAKGTGTTSDPKKAGHWFIRAADSGSLEAQFALGVLHLNSAEFAPAFSNFERAATGGLSRAQFNLALMYESGVGCERNLDQAIMWFKRAAAADLEAASDALRRLDSRPDKKIEPVSGNCTSAWAFSQNPEHFTVQVAMGTNASATIKLLERYGDNVVKGCYPAILNGKRCYFALVGSHPSYSAAISFLDSIESKLRVYSPWVRSFKSIQATRSD